MSESDKGTRKTAVPFVATPYGYNLGLPSEDAIQLVDFLGTISTTPALRVMRLCKPERGDLIQAYMNLFMTAGSALTAKVAIGRFDTDGINVVTPTQAEIDAGHFALTGTTTPFTASGGSLIIDGLNLVKLIPKLGQTNYNKDGFVVIVQFSRDITSSDPVRRFEVSCSVQMGLL
jgi:hypothetical protein